jgi:hypothetical protein
MEKQKVKVAITVTLLGYLEVSAASPEDAKQALIEMLAEEGTIELHLDWNLETPDGVEGFFQRYFGWRAYLSEMKETYIGKPCTKCGGEERYKASHKCVECKQKLRLRYQYRARLAKKTEEE